MNLALGFTEEFYSLQALSEKYSKPAEDVFDLALNYVQARDCFKKEWDKMQAKDECPLPNDCLIDKCFSNE